MTLQKIAPFHGGERSFEGTLLPVEGVSWYDAVQYCNARSDLDNLTRAYTIKKDAKGNITVIWDMNANGWRLPTDAEWEIACRAGTPTAYNTGDALTEAQANFGKIKNTTTTVGSYNKPNEWGLHDMHGNVWEWCWDWYDPFADEKGVPKEFPHTLVDPSGPYQRPDDDHDMSWETSPQGGAAGGVYIEVKSGDRRVIRGGSWLESAGNCRSSTRKSAEANFIFFSMPSLSIEIQVVDRKGVIGFRIVRNAQLNGAYLPSDQEKMEFPTIIYKFSRGTFTRANSDGIAEGISSHTDDSIEFVHSDGKIEVCNFSRTPDSMTITINGKTFVRITDERFAAIEAIREAKAEEAAHKVKAEEAARKAKEVAPVGFIALSEAEMNWADAVAWCKQMGGRLPRYGNRDSFSSDELADMFAEAISLSFSYIDGFGLPGKPWPAGLPCGSYWTGTECSDYPDYSWFVYSGDSGDCGDITITGTYQSADFRVVCVP
jgi:formylglycine-generating enzyme required for sulfatase activity